MYRDQDRGTWTTCEQADARRGETHFSLPYEENGRGFLTTMSVETAPIRYQSILAENRSQQRVVLPASSRQESAGMEYNANIIRHCR